MPWPRGHVPRVALPWPTYKKSTKHEGSTKPCKQSIKVAPPCTHLVVAGQAVDARLDQNQAELSVLVLSVALQVLPAAHGLLDEEVKILGQLRGKSEKDVHMGDDLMNDAPAMTDV